MDIIIHTYGRADRRIQHTLRQLLTDNIHPMLVVQERERHLYDWYKSGHVHVLPGHITTLAPTRDYIIHSMPGDDHVVFLDDDLHFAVRRDDDRTKFRQPRVGDLCEMFRGLDTVLKMYPMAGIGAREGGNRVTEQFVYNTRIMRVLAFRRSYLKKHNICFTPMVVMEDFHVNLQILRSGADTCVLNDWVSNQAGGSDAPGGCSTYRSDAVQTAAAHMLAGRHPGFVKVVQKATKTAWGGGTRTDVTVQWKKARASAGVV
jgi:hypothetical protein